MHRKRPKGRPEGSSRQDQAVAAVAASGQAGGNLEGLSRQLGSCCQLQAAVMAAALPSNATCARHEGHIRPHTRRNWSLLTAGVLRARGVPLPPPPHYGPRSLNCKETLLSQWMLSLLNSLVFNVALGVPLVQKSHDTLVELFRFERYVERKKVHLATFIRFHWNHYRVFPDFSDDWPSRGQKTRKGWKCRKHKIFSLDPQLNFMFSTYSPLFCCLSTRGPEVSHPSWRFLYTFGNPGLLCAASVAAACWLLCLENFFPQLSGPSKQKWKQADLGNVLRMSTRQEV